MVLCDMCGKEEARVKAIIEGSVLEVCSRCAKFGDIIEIKKNIATDATPSMRDIHRQKMVEEPEEVEIVVQNFAEIIKKARERADLTQEKLGEAIAEKISVIQNVESGHLTPPLALARKFEQFLHIILIATYKPEYEKKDLNLKDSSLTIGDLIKLKKSMQKEKA